MQKLRSRFARLSRAQKFILFALIAVVVVIGFNASRNRPSGPTYVIEPVTKSNVVKTITASGAVNATKSQAYTFINASTAKVTEILVAPGQAVTAGQLLAKMDPADLYNRYLLAQSALQQARNNYDNTKLKGGKSVSYLDLRNLEERIKTAESDFSVAERNLSSANLTATFNGVVLSAATSVGSPASQASIVVADPTNYYLSISLAESDAVNTKLAMPVEITFDSLPGKTFDGEISEITLIPTVSANIASYPAKIKITDLDKLLQVGLTGDAKIVLAQKLDVLSVSAAAVITRQDRSIVRKLVNGGLVEVPVEIGLVGDTKVEITSGLNLDEQIVVSVLQAAVTPSPFGGGGGSGGGGFAPIGGQGNTVTSRSTTSN